MPEIAEAHIMAEDLSVIEGSKIISCEYYSDKFSDLPIENKVVESVCAIGKRIIFILDEGYLLSTLSMTGKWVIPSIWEGNETLLDSILTYAKFKMTLSNDNEIYFSDVRTWGNLEYLDEIDSILDKLGPDILNGELTLNYWLETTAKSRKKICDFLTDQSLIAGIGNYLRAEILYHGKINPQRITRDLNDKEKKRLYRSMIKIANLAFESGGLSISNNSGNYISPKGLGGIYEAKVYNKKDCPKGHTVSRISGSQTVHYCDKCQK